MRRKTSTALLLLMASMFAASLSAAEKKVIAFSAPPNARVFHDNVQEMERLMPVVDGVTIYPVTDKGGVATEALGRMIRVDFHRLEDFDTGIDLMRNASTHLYRDNFLLVYLTSGVHSLDVPDWLDPEFDSVVNNWRVAAEYAKLAGMRGLLFDDEIYYGNSMWTYHRLKYADSTSAEDYYDFVFDRGAEIMRGINEVYPDIHILSLHGPTHAGLAGGRRFINRYEMMRAFFDGLLSECTGNAAIIDGSERTYGLRTAERFEGAANTFRNARKHSRVPEKFDRHGQVAFPVFLGSTGFSTEDFDSNYYSPEDLTTALSGALEHTDQYVWIYTENVGLWDRPGMNLLPEEYREAMLRAHDPGLNVPTAVVEANPIRPRRHALAQNYPNPFNSDTVIRFMLPDVQHVELTVHNLAGQTVATLLRESRHPGTHEVRWDGRDLVGNELGSGVYLYRLRIDRWHQTRKLLLLR